MHQEPMTVPAVLGSLARPINEMMPPRKMRNMPPVLRIIILRHVEASPTLKPTRV